MNTKNSDNTEKPDTFLEKQKRPKCTQEETDMNSPTSSKEIKFVVKLLF